MPLFRDRPIRTGAIVVTMLFVGHYATKFLSSVFAFHLTLTSVAVLAVATLLFLVTMHNRREAQFLSQSEQEMLLLGGMALFWIAALVAWRGSRGGETRGVSAGGGGGGGGARYDEGWGCRKGDVYCMVEEYSYW